MLLKCKQQTQLIHRIQNQIKAVVTDQIFRKLASCKICSRTTHHNKNIPAWCWFLILPLSGAFDIGVPKTESAVFVSCQIVAADAFDANACWFAKFQIEPFGVVGFGTYTFSVAMPVFAVLTWNYKHESSLTIHKRVQEAISPIWIKFRIRFSFKDLRSFF